MYAKFYVIYNTITQTLRRLWHVYSLRSLLQYVFGSVFIRGPTGPTGLSKASIAPASYVYTPLESPQHIRLFELLPSQSSDAIIRCTMCHVELKSLKRPYTAVSYAWGPRDVPKATIICNDLTAHIPRTLYSALRRLRAASDLRQVLWADALCIDQADTDDAKEEKSRQVQMMDQIFAQAQEVVVDLGEVQQDDLDTLKVLSRYEAPCDATWRAIAQRPNLPEVFECLNKLDLAPADSPFWEKFTRFACRPWYTRIWIIQEFVLARKIRFLIGGEFRDESFLKRGIVRAYEHLSCLYTFNQTYTAREASVPQIEENLATVADSASAIVHMLGLREHDDNTGTFCEQLHAATGLYKATDTRDKVYALFGLSSDADIKTHLPVNYNEDLPDLAFRVSKYLARGFGIYPLYHCVGDKPAYVSWALDLENTQRDDLTAMIHASGYTRPHEVFRACGGATDFRNGMSLVRPTGLRLLGWIVDEIDCHMTTNLLARGEIRGRAHLAEQDVWFDDAYSWMLSVVHLQHLPEDAFVDQCWRTTIADMIKGSGQEAKGFVRLRDWQHSTRCLDVWRAVHQVMYRRRHPGPRGRASKDAEPRFSDRDISDLRVFAESVKYALGRKLGLTRTRRTSALLPHDARAGDLVVVIQGCQIPFLLRRNTDAWGEYFRIVGCVYAWGIMDGEAVDGCADEARVIEVC
ncbi:hypothetical protein A1O7_09331 [Cladophialophora yegresii CBS 114405]|uniref:Heterokaryon incompatibility domain-containing protein n=1 Tax=Cladophialophora yegresii CBS 114405 TaxID=1182544 RepID=W9W601_9EURO|nr:uncharacterized protein A1O7_09331 [Cladophialophora yegresii CBS 114405]EXJ53994.1 hypothetical protein A1O7_09331 [Cladophialophora yegresii CBS 114405]